jgi:hypothetical protein
LTIKQKGVTYFLNWSGKKIFKNSDQNDERSETRLRGNKRPLLGSNFRQNIVQFTTEQIKVGRIFVFDVLIELEVKTSFKTFFFDGIRLFIDNCRGAIDAKVCRCNFEAFLLKLEVVANTLEIGIVFQILLLHQFLLKNYRNDHIHLQWRTKLIALSSWFYNNQSNIEKI